MRSSNDAAGVGKHGENRPCALSVHETCAVAIHADGTPQEEQQMNALLKQVLQAHGGLDRWTKFTRVTATIIGGGGLWALKGLEAITTRAR
jgi:polysaccharide pyruvyl transferase WcaK-like protein